MFGVPQDTVLGLLLFALYIMQLTNKRMNETEASYTLEGTVLENVDSIKNLGVTMKWNIHITNICTKANRTLGFLRRNLFPCPQDVKEVDPLEARKRSKRGRSSLQRTGAPSPGIWKFCLKSSMRPGGIGEGTESCSWICNWELYLRGRK